MNLRPVPEEAAQLIDSLPAPPRLRAHLALVHDTAARLVEALRRCRPDLACDWEAVLFGAATHDLGKVRHPEELRQPGSRHEAAGEALLLELGVAPERARFARTHGRIDPDGPLEDLLVSLADRLWKGKRDDALEEAICRWISAERGETSWAAYLWLDDLLTELAAGADARLAWHAGRDV